jgi:hypothetical protein
MSAVIASSTAMSAVNANDQAVRIWMLAGTNQVYSNFANVAAVAASSTAMSAVAASSTAMSAVWASNTATDAITASSTAKLAVYNSDTALAQLQYNPTQVQRLVTNTATLSSDNWGGAANLVANGTRIIILRRYYSNAEFDYINWARGSTTTGVGHGPVAGAGGRTLYTSSQARGCVSGTYNDNGALPTDNNDTANFVCAANGLRRDTANNGATQFVYYIPVGA